MSAVWLLAPILLIRYLLLYLVNRDALSRAAHYPPAAGMEKAAYWAYQASTALMLVLLFFLKVKWGSQWACVGLAVCVLGAALYAVSTINFAKPGGMNRNGLYRFSRNPMYVSYFVYFLGCSLLTHSWLFFALLAVFQVSAHWIILSEERWCRKTFGDEYTEYCDRVRRYF